MKRILGFFFSVNTSVYSLPFSIDNIYFLIWRKLFLSFVFVQKRMWAVNNQIVRTTEELLTSYLGKVPWVLMKKRPSFVFRKVTTVGAALLCEKPKILCKNS